MTHKKRLSLTLLLLTIGWHGLRAQSASFNFTAFPHIVSGWTNVVGDPSFGVRSVAAPSGIVINSVATGNWSQYGDQCAFDSLGENVNGFFPAAVLFNHWYTYEAVYNAAKPQFRITGLNKDSVYTLRMAGSTTSALTANPSLYTVAGLINYGVLGANNHNNVTDGVTFAGVSPDSTGTILVYVSTLTTTNVADISGLVISSTSGVVGNLKPGPGIAQLGNALALGDSVKGLGPHSFSKNRYQFLNGHQYSFGGSRNDPVNKPVLRLYDNGGLAVGITMDRSVNTLNEPGMRYYPKKGLLQLGGSDVIDTSASNSSGPGIVINLDDANSIKGRLYSSILSGDLMTVDTLTAVNWSIVFGEETHISAPLDHSLVIGFGNQVSASASDLLISGASNQLTKSTNTTNEISGFENTGVDTARASLIGGANVQFGGLFQFAAGVSLTNRTPGGAVLGSGNVDFSSLPYTGLQGISTPSIASYPLLALGNAKGDGTGIEGDNTTLRSNAFTVLYTGRTQVNTTGYSNTLTQAAVTPQAALDVVSTNSGVLLPRLTTAQRNGIATGDLHGGLLLYNSDSSVFQYYNGSVWNVVGSGTSGGVIRWLSVGAATYDSLDNIAIGTSNTQGYKFAVNGAAVFTRMVVKPPASWPDLVFGHGYPLRGLDDLGRYIRARRHLPGVASVKEIARQGVDVGAQQAVLLKKVEELTLYMIELDKQATALERQNARLRAQGARHHMMGQGHEIKSIKPTN